MQSAAKATILCIDDEPASMDLRRRVLEQEGYRVVVTANPQEGMRLFKEEAFDLVVLDYWMAKLNGLLVAKELKQMKPKVPIVMLSGYSPLLDEYIGRVDEWIVKGESDPADLINTVRQLLKARHSHH